MHCLFRSWCECPLQEVASSYSPCPSRMYQMFRGTAPITLCSLHSAALLSIIVPPTSSMKWVKCTITMKYPSLGIRHHIFQKYKHKSIYSTLVLPLVCSWVAPWYNESEEEDPTFTNPPTSFILCPLSLAFIYPGVICHFFSSIPSPVHFIPHMLFPLYHASDWIRD